MPSTATCLEYLLAAPLGIATSLFFAQNLAMFAISSALGTHLYRRAADAGIQAPATITRAEIGWGLASVAANTAVPVAGLLFYRAGMIGVSGGVTWPAFLIELMLFMGCMDAMMYALHRLAHLDAFAFIHRLHHRFANPTPISLFVLHPLEAMGFGALWILLLAVHPFSIGVLAAYTILNLLFGLVGHAGVEPFPRAWVRWPILRFVTTSTFHNQHHADPRYNFGFYTSIWDALFGTMHPEYAKAFERNAERWATCRDVARENRS